MNNLIQKISKYKRPLEAGMSVDGTAVVILTEVIYKGKSSGWSTNDLTFKDNLDKKLAKFNVYYTDDFNGTYELKEE